MKRECLAALAIVLLAGCNAGRRGTARRAPDIDTTIPASPEAPTAPAALPVGWTEASLEMDGTQRWYRILIPRNRERLAPAVLLLHGGKQSMRKVLEDGLATAHWVDVAEREGIVLIVPNGTNPRTGSASSDEQHWNDIRPDGVFAGRNVANPNVDDVGFVRALLAFAREQAGIDPSRTYVTGSSNGGLMTFRLLMEMPEAFAAGVTLVANLPEADTRMRTPAMPTPLMMINGTKDELVRWDGGMIARSNGRMRSTPATRDWWVAANRARTTASSDTLPDRNRRDECRVHRERYPATSGGAPVVFCRVEGGGHTNPTRGRMKRHRLIERTLGPICGDIETAEFAWDFMKQHRRRQ